MVLVVLRIKTHAFWIVVSCLWSDQSEFMALFMVFNLWIGLCCIFEPCSYFLNFSIAIFLLLPLDYICYQVYIFKSYSFYGAH